MGETLRLMEQATQDSPEQMQKGFTTFSDCSSKGFWLWYEAHLAILQCKNKLKICTDELFNHKTLNKNILFLIEFWMMQTIFYIIKISTQLAVMSALLLQLYMTVALTKRQILLGKWLNLEKEAVLKYKFELFWFFFKWIQNYIWIF